MAKTGGGGDDQQFLRLGVERGRHDRGEEQRGQDFHVFDFVYGVLAKFIFETRLGPRENFISSLTRKTFGFPGVLRLVFDTAALHS